MPDLQDMLINFSRTFPELWRLVTTMAYVFGMSLMFRAIYKLKIYGELRAMMATHTSIKGPVVLILVGAIFLYIPTAFNTLIQTFFGSDRLTPLSYVPGTDSATSGLALVALLRMVQLVGLIAFIRGWILVGNSQQQGAPPGQFGKGMTHIVGGLLAINIAGTRDILWNTFGIGTQ